MLNRPLKVSLDHFCYKLVFQDQHNNCEKFYDKTRIFLKTFESLTKVALFHQFCRGSSFHPDNTYHVMLVVGKF